MAKKSLLSLRSHVTVVALFVVGWINLHVCLGLKRDPRDHFYGHRVVHPRIYSESREKRDLNSVKKQNGDTLTVDFTAYDRHFIIDLTMNSLLLPRNYFQKYYENGTQIVKSPMNENNGHCHYQGKVRGISHSFAAISTCNGLSGIVNDGLELYYIQPTTSDKKSHFLFRARDMKPHNLTCGASDSSDFLTKPRILESHKRKKRSHVRYYPTEDRDKTRYVELVIINDNREFKEFNRDKVALFERSIEIANIVNGLYAPLNIVIALVGVIIWSDYDRIRLSPDGDATLTNFLRYRQLVLSSEHPNDNAQLITRMAFNGNVVGKALKGPICTYEFSGGVNMDHSPVVGMVAATVAHELGHNFGMEHDANDCDCPDDKCIMAAASSSISPRHWSSCSVDSLDHAFSQGMDYCLKNYPKAVFGPVCGNGFLDKGEECDCGLPEFCNNKCCNASSCELFPNSTCATGECCDLHTCQVMKKAILCRIVATECDLPEYCNGISEFCPADVFHQNGMECGDMSAYCFDGQCKSRLDQCKLLWGRTGKVSNVKCFQQNIKGTVNGNCGYNQRDKTYQACRKEDAMCGMLHCTHQSEKLAFGMESATTFGRSYIYEKGKTYVCKSAVIDLGLYDRDPGLVPNGAKCGNGKVCLNQNCIPIEEFTSTNCSFNCNGHGVCNNKGNCHCRIGYGPPYCQSFGPGGSIDSGPAAEIRNYSVIALYIVFLGLLPSLVLLVIMIYYFRSQIKKCWCKMTYNANKRSRARVTPEVTVQPPYSLNISGPMEIPSIDCKVANCQASALPQSTIKEDESSEKINNTLSSVSQSVDHKYVDIKSNVFLASRPGCDIRRPEWALHKTSIAITANSSRGNVKETSPRLLNAASLRPVCPPPPRPVVKSEPGQDYLPGTQENSADGEYSNTFILDVPGGGGCQLQNLIKISVNAPKNVNNSEFVDKSYQKKSYNEQKTQNLLATSDDKPLNTGNQNYASNETLISRSPKVAKYSVVAMISQKFAKENIPTSGANSKPSS